jgi:hypothetical protein
MAEAYVVIEQFSAYPVLGVRLSLEEAEELILKEDPKAGFEEIINSGNGRCVSRLYRRNQKIIDFKRRQFVVEVHQLP